MLSLKKVKQSAQYGFTLLEVLLVVAIISILAGIVIIAINPSKNLEDSRNAQRSSDVTTILNAVYQYSLDFSGALPPQGGGAALSTTPTEICATGGTCTGLIDLGALTSSGTYLVAIPEDPECPTGCDANGTGYEMSRDANNRVTVSSMNEPTITVTR